MRLDSTFEEHIGLILVTCCFVALYGFLIHRNYHKQPNSLPAIARILRASTECMGSMLGCLAILMVIAQAIVVVITNFFADTSLSQHLVAMQEAVTWMFGTLFMLGAAYTLYYDEHVRVDVIYRILSPRKRAFVNLFGTVVLLIPSMLLILWFGWDYVSASWRIGESSNNDLPGLYILKSALVIMTVQMLIQAIVMLIENSLVLFGKLADVPHPKHHEGGL